MLPESVLYHPLTTALVLGRPVLRRRRENDRSKTGTVGTSWDNLAAHLVPHHSAACLSPSLSQEGPALVYLIPGSFGSQTHSGRMQYWQRIHGSLTLPQPKHSSCLLPPDCSPKTVIAPSHTWSCFASSPLGSQRDASAT